MAEQQNNFAHKRKINLQITTPRGVKFKEEADMIIMRCIDGDLVCLPVTRRFHGAGRWHLRIFNNGGKETGCFRRHCRKRTER